MLRWPSLGVRDTAKDSEPLRCQMERAFFYAPPCLAHTFPYSACGTSFDR